jgi:hypothetical protein
MVDKIKECNIVKSMEIILSLDALYTVQYILVMNIEQEK